MNKCFQYNIIIIKLVCTNAQRFHDDAYFLGDGIERVAELKNWGVGGLLFIYNDIITDIPRCLVPSIWPEFVSFNYHKFIGLNNRTT
jgi:hypothetical protein